MCLILLQEPAYKNYKWDQGAGSSEDEGRREIRFKELALAVKFTSSLFGKAIQRRIKATILYATETGKSEKYAKLLADMFNNVFNAQVQVPFPTLLGVLICELFQI